MSIFDLICEFADRMWRDMLQYHGIQGADVGEYEVSALVVEFFSVVNAI